MINISQIIFDTREQRLNEVKNIMIDISGFALYPNWEIKALEYGDIYLENNSHTMLIERKEYKDYINSIGNDLKVRLMKMRQNADFAMLLLEDAPNIVSDRISFPIGGNNFKYIDTNVYNNFLLSRGMDGIIIFPTINLKHTIISVLNFYDYLGRLDKRKAAKPINPKELLEMFPGIGRKRANLLSKKYKNMAEALDNWREWINEKDKFKFYGSW